MNYVSTAHNNDSANDAYITANYKNSGVVQTEMIDYKWPVCYTGNMKQTTDETKYSIEGILNISRAQTAEERGSANERSFSGHRFDD